MVSDYIRIELKDKNSTKISSITWEINRPFRAITFCDGKWGLADRDWHGGNEAS